MEFLILLGALVFGFLVGWHAREQYAMRKVEQILNMMEESEEEQTTTDTERMRIERHNNVLYAYTDKHEFIGQGETLLDLDDCIQKRFPGRKFIIKRENLEEVGAAHEHL